MTWQGPLRPPQKNGCWFCYDRYDGPVAFDVEFDTHVHPDCIRKALEKDPDDFEAKLMWYIVEANS